jgi:adenylyltransferase/sulfurtransferase
MKEITPAQLKALKDQHAAFQLIDVREPHEFDICEIGGTLIPMGEVVNRLNEIRKDIPVVVHCRSGKRSAAVVETLEKLYGYTNVSNLAGGILGYAEQVDPTLTRY